MKIKSFWRDLSISKKLYFIVGTMALVIAVELFSLFFAMNAMSSLRALVGGEGLWSKAQKNASLSLQRYARTNNEAYFQAFQKYLQVQLGNREARVELSKEHPNIQVIREGFTKGRTHPEDIEKQILFLKRFKNQPYVASAINIWTRGDEYIQDLITLGDQLKAQVSQKAPANEINLTLDKIELLNDELSVLEDRFSYTLGEASRLLEQALSIIFILIVLTVEVVGIITTYILTSNLSKNLHELNYGAQEIGKGNFSHRVPIRSKDELSELAHSLNKMARNLEINLDRRTQAEHNNNQKSLFLAHMSHEIRTPLGAIIGFAELLEDNSLSNFERQKYISIIRKTGQSLTKIINDILDLSKVEAGHIQIEKTTFSLPILLDEIHSLIQAKKGEKEIDVIFSGRGPIPNLVFSDPDRIRQILMNILGNALKFTEKGFVKMIYEVKNNKLFFTIEDSGPGIAAKDRSSLFKPFCQLQKQSLHEGTGLGLVLSQKFARMMGGDVNLKNSAPNQGCTFEVSIDFEEREGQPYSLLKKEKTLAQNTPHFQGLKVLLVEDNADNRLLIDHILTKFGAITDSAADGKEGLEKALNGEFDIVLMDIQMPVMDGYTAAKKLRSANYKKTLIALTAHAMKEDREHCLRVGFDDYLSKPIQTKELVQVLSKWQKKEKMFELNA